MNTKIAIKLAEIVLHHCAKFHKKHAKRWAAADSHCGSIMQYVQFQYSADASAVLGRLINHVFIKYETIIQRSLVRILMIPWLGACEIKIGMPITATAANHVSSCIRK